MPEQLRNVQHIQATKYAFAAILESGAVVTWGDQEEGGDIRQVQDQLRNVQPIQATVFAFAAILESGAVVTNRLTPHLDSASKVLLRQKGWGALSQRVARQEIGKIRWAIVYIYCQVWVCICHDMRVGLLWVLYSCFFCCCLLVFLLACLLVCLFVCLFVCLSCLWNTKSRNGSLLGKPPLVTHPARNHQLSMRTLGQFGRMVFLHFFG